MTSEYVFVCSKPVCTDESPDDLSKMTLEQIKLCVCR